MKTPCGALVMIALVACKSPVDCSGSTPVSVLGSWNYAATQNAPTTASLAGALSITGQCGNTFTGTLDVTETDAQGSRRRTGTVSGRAVDSGTVTFDVFLTTVGRQHLGSVARDSMRGTWVEPNDVASASGSFLAVKSP
jgi:hypothetical protein